MPPKRTSSRARRSQHPTSAQPRRIRVPNGATSVANTPSTPTRSRTDPPPTQTRSKANPYSRRTKSTTNTPAQSGPIAPHRSQAVISHSVPLIQIGTANTNTPNRRSASSRSTPLASSRNSRASYTSQTETIIAAPQVVTQPEMDVYLESELHNAIFYDPKFIERFLTGSVDKLGDIERHCRTNNQHYDQTREWALPERVPDEKALYEPIVKILNTIKQAVDHVHPPPLYSTTDAADPPQLFVNCHKSAIGSDLADTALIKPDLVLFHDHHRHWENVRMPIEVKVSPGLHKAGLKQLSRYTRATFAHQLHRRHLYGMIFCKTQATFVRFDRAGILSSERVDIVKDAGAFTRAFASLLMLDQVDEGFDPAFTFERDTDGRLIYYIDLPEFAFAKSPRKTTSIKLNSRTRRFRVVQILCHRESICGGATIVLRIQEELDTDTQNSEEYALKMIWRDPERGSEGEVLEQTYGKFGLAQSIWHCDVSMPGKCQCPFPVSEWCTACVDKTVQVDGLKVCDKLRDVNNVVPLDCEDAELEHVDTTDCHPTSLIRFWVTGARLTLVSCIKRRKTNSHAAAPVISPTDDQNQGGDDGLQLPPREKRRLIDFRTSSLGFLITTICLDDLESFFWVMFWSVVAHLDEGQDYPTLEAQQMLNKLNQDDLSQMSDSKTTVFTWVKDPEEAEENLAAYANEWASDPMFLKAIVDMGIFLSSFIRPKDRIKLGDSLGDVFAEVARIFLSALGSDD